VNSKLKRVAITTLGCKTNQFESAAMHEILEKEGFAIVPFEEPADVYVINTCTVTARSDAESRKLIRRAKRKNPEARVVVTGCYAQVAPEQLSAMTEVELVIGNEEKSRLPALLKGDSAVPRVMVSDIAAASTAEPLKLSSFSEHTRAFLQVQNGCDSFCSYCIVPHARGRSRSVPQQAVLDEIALLSAKGFRELVLTGIHLGNYGKDLSPPTTLLRLIAEIEGRRLTPRLRLGSLEPLDITDEMIDTVAKSAIVCPHLHIPLQSGSDRVLALMNRGYDRSWFRELCGRIFTALPDICIGCDVIVGFPGETEEEFNETVTLLEELPIAYLHVFPFSSRPGTKAALMPGHLQSRVITSRAERLRHLGARKKQAYLQRFVGRTLDLLALQQGKDGLWTGLSANYLTVGFPMAGNPANSIVTVRIVGVAGDRLMGESEERADA
jgi:threonylcarbamoyladenosine tRNA methylthiotransferase MtaB